MNKTGIAAVLCLALVVSSLTVSAAQDDPSSSSETAPQAEGAQLEPPPAGYRLQTDDAMQISVWGEPDLSVEQVIDPKGYINMPLLGQLHVEGLTQKELTGKLRDALTKYLVEPKVQVTIVRFYKPRVYVLGQVNRPGLHEFKMGDRVVEAIAQAGSFTELAYLEGATLTHKDSEERIPLDLKKLFDDGDMSVNLTLADGDTIYIPEDTTNKYYVLGEVLRPGMYRLKDKVTVIDAVSNAGGPTPRGSLGDTSVMRGEGENRKRIEVDVSKLIKSADMTQNVDLQPGDVVYVPKTSKPDWSKISSLVSALVNTSYLIRIWELM